MSILTDSQKSPERIPSIRASGIIYIRTRMKELGPLSENKFLEQLSQEDAEVYRTVLQITFVPLEIVIRIYDAAVAVLYPDQENALRRLGYEISLDNFKGIYRSLVGLATVSFLVRRGAMIWRRYHSLGNASARKIKNENKVIFEVTDYPELPEKTREVLCGYLEGMAVLARANFAAVRRGGNPTCWRWTIEWGKVWGDAKD
jgi:hypothetical protein